MVEKLVRHKSHRLQGLSLDSPLTVEGQEEVTMEQPASANVPVGTTLASETRDTLTVYTNPLVQFPLATDASMHLPLEGHINIPFQVEFFLDAPF